MARWMRCRVKSVSVQGWEFGQRIGFGKVVDFDEVLVKASGKRKAVTMADALKGREDCFEPCGEAATSAAPAADAAPAAKPKSSKPAKTATPSATPESPESPQPASEPPTAQK